MARKLQAELSYGDSMWVDTPPERSHEAAILAASRPTEDLSYHHPLPTARGKSIPVICLECSRKFHTRSYLPECPGCGGSDVEIQ